MIMYRKAGLYLPFYRQEMDFGMSGVPIPRETQARWFIKGALEYLEPIYNRLHEELLRRDLIHADEVPCQVLHEDGRKATQKSYMWIFIEVEAMGSLQWHCMNISRDVQASIRLNF